ncbi:leucine-rich repeat-containing protein 37A-like [Oryctolagus cuniculus]|uniref:leucine-rich repeat-containing protein 37A-like n=1 Tax=Oryctolagus cuniculus TaxID=9986 RepID=UPI003877C94C
MLRAYCMCPSSLSHCILKTPSMTPLCLWVPWLLFNWQPLWLPVQATQPLEWAQDLVQLTSSLPWLSEPWSSHSPNFPPESPDALTPPADPGGFDYLGSSALSQMLASPRESTVSLLPFLDMDSAQGVPPESEQLAVPKQYFNRLTRQQRLPEAIPVLDGDQVQPLALPPRLEGKIHQSLEAFVLPLDSQDSQGNKLIVSPLTPKKDLARRRRLPKVGVGTPDKAAKLQGQNQVLLADYGVYPGGFPTESQENPGEPAQPSEQAEPSQFLLEGQTQNPETQEPIQSSSAQQEGQAPPPQAVEPDEPPSPQQEGPGADLQQPEEEASPLQQEAPAQNPFATAEVVGQASVYHSLNTPSSPQIVALQANFPSVTLKPADTELTEASGAGEEVQSTPSTEQAPAQPLGHPEGVGLPSAQQEAPEQIPEFPGKVESWTQEGLAQTSDLPEETGPFSTQNDATAQPSEYAEEVSPSVAQQGAPAQPSGLPVNTEYSSSNQEQPAQPSESPEIEPSRSQLEDPEKPSALPVEVKSPVQQDPRAQALESPEETIIAQTPQIQKGTDWSPDQNQVHRYNLPNVTIKPADVALTITPEPTMERDSSPVQQEGSAQTPGPSVETEPYISDQEQPTQYVESSVENKPSPAQQETPYQTLGPSLETEASPAQQEPPEQTPVPSAETEPSPFQQAPRAHTARPSVEAEPSPREQEQIAQYAEALVETQPPPGPPVETEPSLREQQQIAQYAEALVETQAPPGQLEALALTPVPPMETEPYISEQEQPRRPSESSEEVESSGKKTEVPAQPPSHHTVTILPPGHHQVQQYDLPNVTTKPPDLQLTLTPKPEAEVETFPVSHEVTTTQASVAALPPTPLEEVEPLPIQSPEVMQDEKPSTTQQEETAEILQTPVEAGPSPIHQEAQAHASVFPTEPEPLKDQEADTAQQPKPLEEDEHSPLPGVPAQPEELKEPSPSQQGISVPPLERPVSAYQLPLQQGNTNQPSDIFPEMSDAIPMNMAFSPHIPEEILRTQHLRLSKTKPKHVDIDLTRTLKPTPEVYPYPSQQEGPAQPTVPTKQVEFSPTQLGPPLAKPPALPEKMELSRAEPLEPLKEAKQDPVQNIAPAEAQDFPNTQSSATQQELQTQQPNLTKVTGQPLDVELTITTQPGMEGRLSPIMQEAPVQLPGPSKGGIAQPPGYQGMTVPTPAQDQAQFPKSPRITFQPFDLALTITPQPITEAELATNVQETPPKESVAQPPVHHEGQNQPPLSPSVTIQPLDLALTITTEPTTEAEHPTDLSKTTAPSPNLTPVTTQHLDLGLNITPETSSVVTEPSTDMQETSSQPPTEGVTQSPIHQEVTVPTLGHNQAQYPTLPHITVQPLDTVLTINAKRTRKAEHSTALKKTKVPPVLHEEVLSQPDQVQAQHPTLTEVTVQPFDVELTLTPESIVEGEPLPTMQETSGQPPGPHNEVVYQPPVYYEMVVPKPSQDQTPHPMSPSGTAEPSKLESTITQVPTTQDEHSTAFKSISPPPYPMYPEVTFSPPVQIQTQYTNLPQVTVKPLDLEITQTPQRTTEATPSTTMQMTLIQSTEPLKELVTQSPGDNEMTVPTAGQHQAQHPTSPSVIAQPSKMELTITLVPTAKAGHSPSLKKTTDLHPGQVQTQHSTLTEVTDQPLNAAATINVCELCTCKDETLSCTGLSPVQKLHKVPLPEPNSYNGTLSML